MLASTLTVATTFAAIAASSPITRQTNTTYVGYLISTFTDDVPEIQQYLSNGNSATNFTFLNDGQPILASTVGTKAVRDVFLATNANRSEFFTLGTGESFRHVVISFTKPCRSTNSMLT